MFTVFVISVVHLRFCRHYVNREKKNLMEIAMSTFVKVNKV